ncbi:hypothetical protein KR044_005495 [Drosophila immigrans]|nr:hypothetical protein KR044_005495 [Drosophila immigrans]
MCRQLLVLLLLVAASQAATHVNISIAQQPATNPADVTIVEGRAPAELRAGPARFERLQERPQQQQQQQQVQQQQVQQQQLPLAQQQSQSPQQQQQQQPLSPRQGLGLQPAAAPAVAGINGRLPRRRNHSRRPSLHQQPPHSGQFRQRNQQLRQNQEFERYIQSYHSHGPSVETVYESSSPSPQRYTQSSSSSSSSSSVADDAVSINGPKSQQLRMFERQIAAPAPQQAQSANVEQQQQQDIKPIYEPAPPAQNVQTASIAPVSSSSSSASSSSVNANPIVVNAPAAAPLPAALPNEAKLGGGNSYETAAYEPAAYDPAFDAGTSYNRPSYDQGGYSYDDAQDDYQDQYAPAVDENSGYDDYDQSGGYLPPQRGYVQPAPPRPVITKTIQIVQPALKAKKYEVRHPAIQKEFYDIEERVVIKPAGTLVVELDHPVAKIPRGETLLPLGHPHPAVASAYNNNNGHSYANEYRPNYEQPAPAAKEQQATTVGSSVTTMPSYEQAPKDEFVEAQLSGGDATDGKRQPAPVAPPAVTSSSSGSSSTITATDGNGNQFQINRKHLTPGMLTRQEPEQNYDFGRSEASYALQRGYQRSNSFNRQSYPSQGSDDYFSGEFLANANAGNVESKPARLEEAPRPQIIKHEHKIHLPPSQHNIYLGRSRQSPPKERRISPDHEVAHVAEVKPFPRNHAVPSVVYAKSVQRTAAPRSYYPQAASRQRSPLAEDLEYSAPYSRMRYDPDAESGRLVEQPKEQTKEQAKAQIHLQIPHKDDRDQSIVATATISPLKPDCDQQQQQQQEQQQQQSSRYSQPQQQHFQRLVEAPAAVPSTQATPTPAQPNLDVDVAGNGAAGHLNRHLQPNERVISATAAPTDAAATSETFHKRRIVVNHPFQTVREVVEHEPITNYHQIQVNEPASPQLYHQAAYYQQPSSPQQTHGNLVQYHSASTHGNLYAQFG